jgi:hypothetical protein
MSARRCEQIQRNVEQATVVDMLQKRLQARERDLHMLQELMDERDRLRASARAATEPEADDGPSSLLDTQLAMDIDSYFAAEAAQGPGANGSAGAAGAAGGGGGSSAGAGGGASAGAGAGASDASGSSRARAPAITMPPPGSQLRDFVFTPKGGSRRATLAVALVAFMSAACGTVLLLRSRCRVARRPRAHSRAV